MNRFTTILWDVDGTLLDFGYSQNYAIKKCFQTIGEPITEEMIDRYSQINDSFWKRLEKKEITREELLPGRFLQLFQEYHIEGVDLIAFMQEYQESLGNVYSFQDDALTILTALHGHMKQYVVTNGVTSTQKSKLRLSEIYNLMEGVFISEQLGADKPSDEFFGKALAQVAEQDRRKILIVGDSLSSDILGGVRAGIATCWYNPKGLENPTDIQPDYEIQDLHQIYEVLEIICGG